LNFQVASLLLVGLTVGAFLFVVGAEDGE